MRAARRRMFMAAMAALCGASPVIPQAQWKQPVVIDYKPGGGTRVGTQAMARAPADGYTLGMAISAHMINPALQPKMAYDTQKDLAGVSLVGQAHFGLFAHPSVAAGNIAELVAFARQNPGKLSYATPGVGTGTHLAGEMMEATAGIHMVHIPYRGSAPAQQDVIAGRVPLIAETLPGFSAMSLIGVIAPSATPHALLDRISADIATAVRSPDMGARMAQLGMEPVGSTPRAYDEVIRTEIAKWTQVVKTAGIKLD